MMDTKLYNLNVKFWRVNYLDVHSKINFKANISKYHELHCDMKNVGFFILRTYWLYSFTSTLFFNSNIPINKSVYINI